jgi:hypothetical protein
VIQDWARPPAQYPSSLTLCARDFSHLTGRQNGLLVEVVPKAGVMAITVKFEGHPMTREKDDEVRSRLEEAGDARGPDSFFTWLTAAPTLRASSTFGSHATPQPDRGRPCGACSPVGLGTLRPG